MSYEQLPTGNDPAKSPNQVELKKIELFQHAIDNIYPTLIKYFEKRLLHLEAPLAKSTIWTFFTIILLSLGGTITLVLMDKLDTSAFTFVVGIILGYTLSLAKMLIQRERE